LQNYFQDKKCKSPDLTRFDILTQISTNPILCPASVCVCVCVCVYRRLTDYLICSNPKTLWPVTMLPERFQNQRRNYRYQNTISSECYKITTHETYSNNCKTGNYGIDLTLPLMLNTTRNGAVVVTTRNFVYFSPLTQYPAANEEMKLMKVLMIHEGTGFSKITWFLPKGNDRDESSFDFSQ